MLYKGKKIVFIAMTMAVVLGGCADQITDEHAITAEPNENIVLMSQTSFVLNKTGHVQVYEFCINGELILLFNGWSGSSSAAMEDDSKCENITTNNGEGENGALPYQSDI